MIAARDHWDELFDELYLETYAAREREEDAGPEALAAARLAGCEPPADILDAPCGYGRHSVPLARAGYRVVGVDRSEVLLAEARRRAGDVEWPSFTRADHRDLPFPAGSFDAVLCIFSSLGFRGEEGDRATLRQFHRVLRRGGRVLVETTHRDRIARNFAPRTWDALPDGGWVMEERSLDILAGELDSEDALLLGSGEHRSIRYRLRLYTATELARLLGDAGFAEIEAFGDVEGGKLTIESRLVLRARKP